MLGSPSGALGRALPTEDSAPEGDRHRKHLHTTSALGRGSALRRGVPRAETPAPLPTCWVAAHPLPSLLPTPPSPGGLVLGLHPSLSLASSQPQLRFVPDFPSSPNLCSLGLHTDPVSSTTFSATQKRGLWKSRENMKIFLMYPVPGARSRPNTRERDLLMVTRPLADT